MMPPDSHSALRDKPQAGFCPFCQSPHCLLPAVRYASKQRASTAGEQQSTGVMGIIRLSSKMNKFSHSAAVKILRREEEE